MLSKGVSAMETDNKSKSKLAILLARDTDFRDRALEISCEYNFSVVAVKLQPNYPNLFNPQNSNQFQTIT